MLQWVSNCLYIVHAYFSNFCGTRRSFHWKNNSTQSILNSSRRRILKFLRILGILQLYSWFKAIIYVLYEYYNN